MGPIFSIDVGATGTKAAIVDSKKGILLTERIKYPTPNLAEPDQIIEIILQLKKDLGYDGSISGMGFPSIIKNGKSWTANNISDSFIGYHLQIKYSKALGMPLYVLNDADAAGMAEMEFGAIKNKKGKVILLTLGTGIGSAFFFNGELIPNLELGSMKYRSGKTEDYAANSARERKELSWKQWGKELNKVLAYYELVFTPELFVIGGGVSKKLSKYSKYLNPAAKIIPATFLNEAGIIGPAIYAAKLHGK